MAATCTRDMTWVRFRTLRAALLVIVAAALTSCSSAQPAADGVMLTFFVVRHAEKGTDDAKDPSLSANGLQRAASLAARLAGEPLVAAYATGYRRTQQTAKPTADAHGIAITPYDAQLPAADFAAQLRANHAQGTVLVVGHSNTVPDIAAALSGQSVPAMADDRFDLIYRIAIRSNGKATLEQASY